MRILIHVCFVFQTLLFSQIIFQKEAAMLLFRISSQNPKFGIRKKTTKSHGNKKEKSYNELVGIEYQGLTVAL